MKIKIAQQCDAKAIANVAKLTFHLACPTDSNRAIQTHYIVQNLSEERFSQLIDDDKYAIWIASDNNSCVAFAVIEHVSNDVAMLSKLYVLPENQGCGIANLLFNSALNYAKDNGFKELVLSVFSENTKAKRFYEKQGFRFVCEEDFIMGPEVHKDYIYKLSFDE